MVAVSALLDAIDAIRPREAVLEVSSSTQDALRLDVAAKGLTLNADLLTELNKAVGLAKIPQHAATATASPLQTERNASQPSTLAAFDTLNNRYWISRAKLSSKADARSGVTNFYRLPDQIPLRGQDRQFWPEENTSVLANQNGKAQSVLEELDAYGFSDTTGILYSQPSRMKPTQGATDQQQRNKLADSDHGRPEIQAPGNEPQNSGLRSSLSLSKMSRLQGSSSLAADGAFNPGRSTLHAFKASERGEQSPQMSKEQDLAGRTVEEMDVAASALHQGSAAQNSDKKQSRFWAMTEEILEHILLWRQLEEQSRADFLESLIAYGI